MSDIVGSYTYESRAGSETTRIFKASNLATARVVVTVCDVRGGSSITVHSFETASGGSRELREGESSIFYGEDIYIAADNAREKVDYRVTVLGFGPHAGAN